MERFTPISSLNSFFLELFRSDDDELLRVFYFPQRLDFSLTLARASNGEERGRSLEITRACACQQRPTTTKQPGETETQGKKKSEVSIDLKRNPLHFFFFRF